MAVRRPTPGERRLIGSWAIVAGAFLVGLGFGWLIATLGASRSLSREREKRIRAQTALEAEQGILEQAGQISERTAESVHRASREAMSANMELFLKLAGESLRGIVAESREDLLRRQEAVDHAIGPLKDRLERFSKEVGDMRSTQVRDFGGLRELLESLAKAQKDVLNETGRLATALISPKIRGRWGELTLKRVLELSGMSEHCDFSEQQSIKSEDGTLRPDLIIHLPGGRSVAVDAKVPFDAYWEGVSAESESARGRALEQHSAALRDHVRRLAGKSYWQGLDASPAFVVLFLPSEAFLSAALHANDRLMEEALERNVLLATPVTLIAVLKAIAQGWSEERLARSAEGIRTEGKVLYKRLSLFAGHLTALGRSLRQAVDAFNKAMGSFETRVLPSARRFHEYGVVDETSLESPQQIDLYPSPTNEKEED